MPVKGKTTARTGQKEEAKPMTKKELVDTVAEKLNISLESAENAVLTTMAAITVGLTGSGSVAIPGFGTFSVTERAARKGRNPKTGEQMDIPAKKVVVFKAGKGLKEAIR